MIQAEQADGKLEQILYRTAKCLEMKEIPLILATDQDKWAFFQFACSHLGGTVIYSTAADATTQFLESIEASDYLFLIVEDQLVGSIFDVVYYYLESRNDFQVADTHLLETFEDYPIHPDHRLILLIDRQVFESQSRDVQNYFRTLCTMIFIS